MGSLRWRVGAPTRDEIRSLAQTHPEHGATLACFLVSDTTAASVVFADPNTVHPEGPCYLVVVSGEKLLFRWFHATEWAQWAPIDLLTYEPRTWAGDAVPSADARTALLEAVAAAAHREHAERAVWLACQPPCRSENAPPTAVLSAERATAEALAALSRGGSR